MEKRSAYLGEIEGILNKEESHFLDFKSKAIKPSKLQESFIAFANADGGELLIGIEDKKVKTERVNGYKNQEEANELLSVLLTEVKPSVENIDIEFIDTNLNGLILHITIPKSPKVHYTASDDCFVRLNASNKKIKGEKIVSLSYQKGAFSYEKQPLEDILLTQFINDNKSIIKKYTTNINTKIKPNDFFRKQNLITMKNNEAYPNVAAVLLFDENPDARLSTRCSIKVYRLNTSTEEYNRNQLKAKPKTIVGNIENQIENALKAVNELVKHATYQVDGKLKKIKYPINALKEILVNAIIHRDYSLNDDIHIKIYDNRLEIISPGRLPGYITTKNIYQERYSRNPIIVRMLHKLPDPPNFDIGEGLDTAKRELNKAGLIEPIIEELDNSVKVTIKHEKLASLIDIIRDHLNKSDVISNKVIRELSGVDDVNKVKKALQTLRKRGEIEVIDAGKNKNTFDYKYRKVQKS